MERLPKPPAISPWTDAAHRPFWSVMIPTYDPEPRYLEETLRSVLDQDPGSDQMQIEVLDDCSPNDGIEKLVQEIAANRIRCVRHEHNLGMAGNWNTAVRRARGQWVHILHQDDLVLPGFYQRIRTALESDDSLGAAHTQHYLIDNQGRRLRLISHNPAREPGILDDWLKYVFVELSFQTPAIVVRRSVYEHLGAFRPEFRYALDWDMWKRIAASYPVWFDPTPLACYRRHRRAATAGFLASGENMIEVRRSIELSRSYLPPDRADEMANAAYLYYAREAIDSSIYSLFTMRDLKTAGAQFREARKFPVRPRFWRTVIGRLFAGFRRWRADRTR